MREPAEKKCKSKLLDPSAWGLPSEEVEKLSTRLVEFWERFASCVETQTRDTSPYALDILSGLLRMTIERNFTNLARVAGQAPQNIQHFMSHSPWEAAEVLAEIRAEIRQIQRFQSGGVLILEESADEKASEKTAGAGRQYNGRMGKIEMSQVGTFLAYAHDGLWTWIDGELFLPEACFKRERAKDRRRLGIPPGRKFATKIELGWRMIERVQQEGLPFEWVACDTLSGRSGWLRRKMNAASLTYLAEVPVSTQVYLTEPVVAVPTKPSGQGRRAVKPRVVSRDHPLEARAVAALPETKWTRLEVRNTERGKLRDEFSARRVWTLEKESQPLEEWLVMRRDEKGQIHYALSNAPAETSLERLAWGKCQRVFIEVANREAKTEAGWDQLRAQKYLAWEHHLALTCLATWFITETKMDWPSRHPRDPQLAEELGLEVEALPALSAANVRELLRAVLPLPQLTVKSATDLVIEHLLNRTRSRKSRLKTFGHKHSLP
jgi:SRSO17 transposase